MSPHPFASGAPCFNIPCLGCWEIVTERMMWVGPFYGHAPGVLLDGRSAYGMGSRAMSRTAGHVQRSEEAEADQASEIPSDARRRHGTGEGTGRPGVCGVGGSGARS